MPNLNMSAPHSENHGYTSMGVRDTSGGLPQFAKRHALE